MKNDRRPCRRSGKARLRWIALALILALALCACGGQKGEPVVLEDPEGVVPTEEQDLPPVLVTDPPVPAPAEEEDLVWDGPAEFLPADPMGGDVAANIRTSLETIVSGAGSLQEELRKVERLAACYRDAGLTAETQAEMNAAAALPYQVWDTELNSLWARLQTELDAAARETLLQEEIEWISLRDQLAAQALEDYRGGSIYPMLLQEENASLTRVRCYQLARILAGARSEEFRLPARTVAGGYGEPVGAGGFDMLSIYPGMENSYMARFSAIRLGVAEGEAVPDGEGRLLLHGQDGLEAEIVYGWDGAVFTVTKDGGPFHAGDSWTLSRAC
ncbi:MAG: DUF1311 domain-containing protein [Oscillospiraceae bacterium]|nr:DUF1311 domain-containing protein [Oscillospiraceae bacterium]